MTNKDRKNQKLIVSKKEKEKDSSFKDHQRL